MSFYLLTNCVVREKSLLARIELELCCVETRLETGGGFMAVMGQESQGASHLLLTLHHIIHLL